MGGAEAEDRTEQHAHTRGAVARAARRRVQREEEDAEAEDPGEHAADHHVVGASSLSEEGHAHPQHDGGGEQAHAGVHPEGEGGQSARHRHVPEGVAREDLTAQDDEVPDQSGGHGDGGAGEEGVAHERVGEHVGEHGHGVAGARRQRGRRTAAAAT